MSANHQQPTGHGLRPSAIPWRACHPIPSMRDMRLPLLGGAAWALAAVTMHAAPPSMGLRVSALILLLGAALVFAWSWYCPSVRGTRHLLPSGSARLTAALLAVLSACFLIRCDVALDQYTSHPIHMDIAHSRQLRCEARILTHPRRTPYGSSYAQARLVKCSHAIQTTETPIDVLLVGQSAATYERGAHAEITGRLSALEPHRPPLAGRLSIDVQHAYRPPEGLDAVSATLRTRLHAALSEAHPATQGLIPGIALGDKAGLAHEDEEAIRAASLSHIIVISGFHTGLIASLAAMVLPGRGIFSMGLSCLLLALIVLLVGAGASVIRAAIMGLIVLVARTWGAGGQSGAALGIAVTSILLADPWAAVSPGFTLSVAATAGVIWPAQAAVHRLRRRFAPRGMMGKVLHALWAMANVSWWAQLCVSPVAAAHGLPLAPWGILANLAVAPILVPLCIGSVASALCVPWAPRAASVIIMLCDPLARWVLTVAHWVAQLPGAQLTIPAGQVVFTLGCVGILVWYARNRLRKRYPLVSDLKC